MKDNMFAALFATDPARQGIHENVAVNWLEKVLKLSVRPLSKSGKNALYINNEGRLVREKSGKSLDFHWKYNGIDFYAMHKFTNESGGNQDSQYIEMQEILNRFHRAEDESIALVVIVDGNYYTETKMKGLKNKTRTIAPKSFAVHIQDVPKILKEYPPPAE